MHKRYVAILLSCLAVCATSGCDEGISALVGGVCSLGETACENGKLKVCALTSWQTTDCPDGCDDAGKVCRIPEGKECAVDTCDAGANNILKRCVDGVYKPEPCPTDKPICQGMACVAEKCEVGKVKCSDDLSATVTCSVTGEWGEPVKCGDGQVCDVAKKTCVNQENAAVCENDAMKCKQEGDKSYYVCKDGQWSTESKSCDGDKVCKGADGKAECKENTTEPDPSKCTAGAKMCDGTNIKTCKEDGTWGTPEPCEPAGYVCDANKDACVPASEQPECTNGKLKCELSDITPNQYKLCVDGKWNTKIDDCPNDKPVCTADGCLPVGQDVCKNGEKKCVGDAKFQVCENGTWSAEKACQAGEKCDKGECVAPAECIDGAKKCKDMGMLTSTPKAYHTCVGGKWSTQTTQCPNDADCNGPAGAAYCGELPTADCKEGSIKCLDSGNSSSYYVCKKDDKNQTYWDPAPLSCPTLCVDIESFGGKKESQCVECNPNAKPTCIDEDVLKSCSLNGKWETTSCAGKDMVCINKDFGGDCRDCKEGEKRCHIDKGPGTNVSSIVQKCNTDNQWVTDQNCTQKDKSCDPNTTTCAEQCVEGTGRCNPDGSFDLCVNKAWQKKAECGSQKNCISEPAGMALMGCNCNKDDKVCDAEKDSILVCKKDQDWVKPNKKIEYMVLEASDSCGKGKCVDSDAKPANAYCKCTTGSFRCVANKDKKDRENVEYCKAGRWVTSQECGDNHTCDASLGTCNTQCTTDNAGAMVCAGWDLLQCPNPNSADFDGKYVKKESCTDGCYMNVQIGNSAVAMCNSVAGFERCSEDRQAIEKKSFKHGGSWDRKECGKSEKCQWVENTGVPGAIVFKPECKTSECEEHAMGCSKDGQYVEMCINNTMQTVGSCGQSAQCDKGKCISTIKK